MGKALKTKKVKVYRSPGPGPWEFDPDWCEPHPEFWETEEI